VRNVPRKRPPPFNEKDKIKILLWSERHCCLCDKPCDTNIVIHHIQQEGRPDEELKNIENAIPLCYDCHGRIKSYNLAHRVGTSYRIEEIKARRNQIYDKYTRDLVLLCLSIFFREDQTNQQVFQKSLLL
jgi:5-methylcytosine-specific restriction endonuclease McrA